MDCFYGLGLGPDMLLVGFYFFSSSFWY